MVVTVCLYESGVEAMRRSLASIIKASPSTSLVNTSSTLVFSATPSSVTVFTITLSPPGFTLYFTFSRPFGDAEAEMIKRRETRSDERIILAGCARLRGGC